ncbi:hypothetical protein, unlikely [Trypanosoma brucei gambiense DAL972]|uniref:Uncharacterized protein n=1 Tax=Trypanosoma brucei gambiense (strain MHOM/CI/86/DAL972) TaxID=679716 RepID=C9ZW79_TRYB9|nr:hypothetical protein, unlikely [Trypanosoma brucei gambiense DAL972]CBH13668.1 hypothetical protein, unlikely [Trypanosoma brucei gambiense DAL972]|eukprot:XP_011775944.1 hypothetical protein, unlikely [Trypanosoma brucei gambiense DAL972]
MCMRFVDREFGVRNSQKRSTERHHEECSPMHQGAYLERWRMRRRRRFKRFMRFLCHLGRIPPGRLMVPIVCSNVFGSVVQHAIQRCEDKEKVKEKMSRRTERVAKRDTSVMHLRKRADTRMGGLWEGRPPPFLLDINNWMVKNKTK